MRKSLVVSQESPTFEFDVLEEPARGTMPIVGDRFRSPANFERRAASRFVTAKDHERSVTENGLAVEYEESGVRAEVEMRPRDASAISSLSGFAASNLREIARGLDGVDEDVLDLLVSNAVENKPDASGWNWIEIDDVLHARGRGLRTRHDGTGYKAGYDDDARDDVLSAAQTFASIFVAVGPSQAVGRKRLVNFAPVLVIERIVLDLASKRQSPVRLAYRFGAGLASNLGGDRSLLVQKSLLQLNGRTEAVPKAIGRHLVQHADSTGSVQRTVTEIVFGSGISVGDGDNRGRARPRVERALDALVERGVLKSWNYLRNDGERGPSAWADFTLPYRNWIDVWMDFTVRAEVDVKRERMAR